MDSKPIPGYPGYSATKCGHIIGKRGTVLKPWPDTKRGYLYVTLHVEGKKVYRYVHRLVAFTYLDNPDSLPQVNHRDEVKTNNALDNLEWMTNRANSVYSRGKPVHLIKGDTSLIAASRTYAAEVIGCHPTGIINLIAGRAKTCHGWRLA